jgi:protein with PEP-CTERM/exosortase system signal
MKINMIPTNKLAMLSAAVCAVMLAFTNNASADATLGFFPPDTHVVGTITPANPADPGDVVNYINFMIALAPGGSGTFHPGQVDENFITRTTNLFGSLPTATNVGSVSGGGTTVDLNAFGTFTYLFAKYDGQNDFSVVWNITGLTGILTIPGFGPNGYALSGWILFNQTGPPVPDGGTTIMLLGAALGGLGMVRRFLKI